MAYVMTPPSERAYVKVRLAFRMMRIAARILDEREPLTTRIALARAWKRLLVGLGLVELEKLSVEREEDLDRVASELAKMAAKLLSPYLSSH